MFFTCFQADECQLPNGVKIPNGWNHLYNNCQERCQCENNNFSCIPNTCDLSKNICIRDELGDSCQGAVFVVGLVQPVIIHFDGKIVRIRKITFFFHSRRNNFKIRAWNWSFKLWVWRSLSRWKWLWITSYGSILAIWRKRKLGRTKSLGKLTDHLIKLICFTLRFEELKDADWSANKIFRLLSKVAHVTHFQWKFFFASMVAIRKHVTGKS